MGHHLLWPICMYIYIYIYTYIHHAEISYILYRNKWLVYKMLITRILTGMGPPAYWIVGSYIEPQFNNKQYDTGWWNIYPLVIEQFAIKNWPFYNWFTHKKMWFSIISYLVGGFNQPLWKMMEFVSWDDYSIPNWMESHKIPWFQSPPSSHFYVV